MAKTSNFYFLYNIKQEPIPEEEEWALRYERFVKRIPPAEEDVKFSEVENEDVGPSEEDDNVKLSEVGNESIKVSQEEEGEHVKDLEDLRPSKFEENSPINTLNDEGSSKEEL